MKWLFGYDRRKSDPIASLTKQHFLQILRELRQDEQNTPFPCTLCRPSGAFTPGPPGAGKEKKDLGTLSLICFFLVKSVNIYRTEKGGRGFFTTDENRRESFLVLGT